tara:strand:- start:1019 stop:1390 length:372 start_codon:yes stop_codon:yes gene_type:complete
MLICKEILLALEPTITDYITTLKKNDLMKKVIETNELCSGEDDICFFYIMFLKGILELKGGTKRLYKIINKKIKNPKKSREFIYKFLKLDYKSELNMWSWNEIIDYEIDTYDRDIKFTNYEIG